MTASKLNMNNQFLPPNRAKSNPKPIIFENTGVSEKINDRKFIPIKIKEKRNKSNSEPIVEKFKSFLRLNKSKKTNPIKTTNEASNISEKLGNKQKNCLELENDQTAYISKSFFSTKREGQQSEPSSISSLDSMVSNLCEIHTIKPKNTRSSTAKKSFNRKFIANLGENYVPKLLTTNACLKL